MICQATSSAHCCYIIGQGVCEHFDASRIGAFCTLMAELNDWDTVHNDPRYRPQKAALASIGSVLCGDWPAAGEACNACGAVG